MKISVKKFLTAVLAAVCTVFMGMPASAENALCYIGEAAAFDSAEAESETANASDICTLNVEGTENYSYAYEVLDIVNKARAEQGRDALKMDSVLLEAAMQRAAENAVYYSHTRPDGTSCFTAFDGGARAENIAVGYASPDAVMNGWLNSSGHYKNIMNESYKSIGVGCFVSNGMLYWVQCFNSGEGDGAVRSGSQSSIRSVNALQSMLNISGSLNVKSFSSVGTAQFTVKNVNTGWSYASAVIHSSSFDYSSSAPAAASVDSNGTVSVKGGGTAVISAKTKVGELTLSDTLTSSIPTAVVKPVITKVIPGNGQVGLNWSSVSGAEKYAVYYRYGGKWYNAGTTAALGKYVRGLTNGVKYGFAVKAYVNGAWTGVSSQDIVYAAPVAPAQKPVITKVIPGNGQVGLNWSSVSGAEKYAVYYRYGGKWYNAGTTAALGKYVRGLANGVKYGFAVKAYVNGAWTGVSSQDIVYAAPVAPAQKPVITKVIPGNGQVGLNWSSVSGAEKYAVYYRYGGKWYNAGTTAALGKYVRGLANGVTYGFAVKAYVNGAWTGVSSQDIVYAAPAAAKGDVTDDIGSIPFEIEFSDAAPTVKY